MQEGIPQSGVHYDIIAYVTQCMSTIQIIKGQPEPAKNLVKASPVKKGANVSGTRLDLPTNVTIKGKDLIGLTWMLLEDDYF
ncbi:conserved hypothetical protein [Candidatus Nitrosotenuis uzonensis]|uniref:Uncharacterized protein n=1 Tax=Candidatus Nitrosotenuis uzonensis TaxID=1407055 RepID=A0A812EVJ0_9ARCH|nr:conserved hypothetical protein [Candidatus Nitrosotenuis uzonensis]